MVGVFSIMNYTIETEPNPLAHYDEIMQCIREEENKGKVPHILCAEPRIGRNIEPEMIEFAKKIGDRDMLSGTDLLRFEMEKMGKEDKERYRKFVSN